MAMQILRRLKKHAEKAGASAEADVCQELARLFMAANQLGDARRQVDEAKHITPRAAGVHLLEARLHQVGVDAISVTGKHWPMPTSV